MIYPETEWDQMGQAITEHKKLLAIEIASDLIDFLVLSGKINEDQGQYLFDRMTDNLAVLPEDELVSYLRLEGVS